jgi:hypothetical protein
MGLFFILLPYFLCIFAGLIMIGGGIWLLAKGKVLLDANTGEVVQFDLPLIGKAKTNIPVLGLFLIGFIPLIYPISTIPKVVSGQTAVEKSLVQVKEELVQVRETLDKIKKQVPRPRVIKVNVTSDTYPVTFYAANKMTELDREEKSLSLHLPVWDGLEEYRIIPRVGDSIWPPSVVNQEMLETNENQPIILHDLNISFRVPPNGFHLDGPLQLVETPEAAAMNSPPPPEYRSTVSGPARTEGGRP